jgi:hypothetical protein
MVYTLHKRIHILHGAPVAAHAPCTACHPPAAGQMCTLLPTRLPEPHSAGARLRLVAAPAGLLTWGAAVPGDHQLQLLICTAILGLPAVPVAGCCTAAHGAAAGCSWVLGWSLRCPPCCCRWVLVAAAGVAHTPGDAMPRRGEGGLRPESVAWGRICVMGALWVQGSSALPCMQRGSGSRSWARLRPSFHAAAPQQKNLVRPS